MRKHEIVINGEELTESECQSLCVAVYTLACALAEDVDSEPGLAAAFERYRESLRYILTLVEGSDPADFPIF